MNRLLKISAVLLLASLIIGSEPLEPPYHQYIVSGTIERNNKGPKQNFVITLAGKFLARSQNVPVELTGFYAIYKSNSVSSITDTAGHFYLNVATRDKADSLALKVSAVDKPSFISDFFPVNEASVVFTQNNPVTVSGCNGCKQQTVEPEYVTGYQYLFPDQFIRVPL